MTDTSGTAARLAHVRWIGGGSGAGKTVVARRLAARHGLALHPTDDLMADHAGRAIAEGSPAVAAFAAMTMDERWVDRSPEEMLATFHWFRGEGFGLIVGDLLAEPRDQPALVEGFRLLPGLVAPLITAPDQAVWLLPTPDFRRAAFAHRGSLWDIAGRTRDPDRALDNLLARDGLFTERLRHETAQLGLRTIEVDGSRSQDELIDQVADALAL